MIYIGWPDNEKEIVVRDYCTKHDIHKVVTISPRQFPFALADADNVEYEETIMYRTFYRLLQEIDGRTLIVLSECLRTQNRYELTYNCIRNFLNQTGHQIVFQQLPQIDTRDDFMILFDFATRSRWKRHEWDLNLILDNAQVSIRPLPVSFSRIDVPTSEATRRKYAEERARLFASLGARDPHSIPRNLNLVGGRDKLAYIDAHSSGHQLSLFDATTPNTYVARNKRLGRGNIIAYADANPEGRPYTLVELPHRFLDYSDFVRRTGQAASDVLVADLKVDEWYYGRYQEWSNRIHETYASLLQQ